MVSGVSLRAAISRAETRQELRSGTGRFKNSVFPNVLWDDTQDWLVDWELAGLAHPYLDVAPVCNFLSSPMKLL
jgi:hypothetical protein